MNIVLLVAIVFGGYAIGRASHVIGGHLNTPDHWIYGVLAIIVGAIFYKHHAGQALIAFGIGHTISDAKDMMNLKFYGPDEPGPRHFWGID
jgi:ABC-type uncharacterized transport system permease subunit